MRRAHTVAQVRGAEEALMATLPPGTLMQRAAFGLATACTAYLGRVYGARVGIVVGAGNNGGDALYAGAALARRGARVEAVLLAEQGHAAGLAALRTAGGRVVDTLTPPNLVVDGILGIGGRPGLRGGVAELVASLDAPVLAVDVPSGIAVDTGELHGPHVRADLTVTFGTYKAGLLLDPASEAAGAVELIDIGLDDHLGAATIEALQAEDVARLLPDPPHASQKYSRGVLGVAAGSPQYTGAALLVLDAAVRSGLAGMIRYAGSATELVRSQFPEVVVGRGRVQAWTVGPGLGEDESDAVREIVAEGMPTVIDADGLRRLPERFHTPAVLTPHAGELARLLAVERSEVENRPLHHARLAAARWEAVVLLKGARSVVAAPDGRVRVNTTGVPWLATAGAGDVLSGLVGVLLAAGVGCFDAASVGAWLHGSAATLASQGGPISATDVARQLPAVLRSVLTG